MMAIVEETGSVRKTAGGRGKRGGDSATPKKPSRRRALSPLVPPEVLEELRRTDENGDFIGAVVFRRETEPEGVERSFIYIGNPYENNPTVVRLETAASREDVEAVREEIIPMRESCEMLTSMAITYSLRQPLLLEGPTAVGKTFLAEKFTELLYGRGNRPLEFYCHGQTDVSELTAKWVPLTSSEEDREAWLEFLDAPETEERLMGIAARAGSFQGTPERKLALIHGQLRQLAEEAGFGESTRWRILYGAIPQAMSGDFNPDGSFARRVSPGPGFILHIEEVGLAEPQIINVLLQLRGRKGGLAESIRLWESSGENITAGPRFWLVLSTNPPEEYFSRNEVDPALARGLVFKRVGGLRRDSLELAARRIFSRRFHPPAERPYGCALDIYDHPEICREVAQLVAALHWEFGQALLGGEKGRSQRIPLTLDDMARVSTYIGKMQVQDPATGLPDLGETLKRAVELYYLDRLADAELKKRLRDSFRLTMRGDLGKKEFRGSLTERSKILDCLVREALMSEEELRAHKEREARKRRRVARQTMDEVKRRLEAILADPEVPDSVKEALRGKWKEPDPGMDRDSEPWGQEDWEELAREVQLMQDIGEAYDHGMYDGLKYDEQPDLVKDVIPPPLNEEGIIDRKERLFDSGALEAAAEGEGSSDQQSSSEDEPAESGMEEELDRLLGDECCDGGLSSGPSVPDFEGTPSDVPELDLEGEGEEEDEEAPPVIELAEYEEVDPKAMSLMRALLGIRDGEETLF